MGGGKGVQKWDYVFLLPAYSLTLMLDQIITACIKCKWIKKNSVIFGQPCVNCRWKDEGDNGNN